MKMKKLFSLLIIVCMVFSIVVPVSAHSNDNDKIKKDLNKLEDKYGVEIRNLDDTVSPDKLIKVNSVEEMDKIIKEFKENNKAEPVEIEIPSDELKVNKINSTSTEDSIARLLSTYNGMKTITWWAPFSGWGLNGIACWRNVAFEYTYKFVNGHPQFTGVSNVSSYLSGIQIAVSWHQTTKTINYSTKYYYKDTAKIKVSGYYLLGFDINGFRIGATINDTWNEASLTLTN